MVRPHLLVVVITDVKTVPIAVSEVSGGLHVEPRRFDGNLGADGVMDTIYSILTVSVSVVL